MLAREDVLTTMTSMLYSDFEWMKNYKKLLFKKLLKIIKNLKI